METKHITVNKKTYQELETAYKKAVLENKKIFIFEGSEMLTAYAKYLLKYMGSILK